MGLMDNQHIYAHISYGLWDVAGSCRIRVENLLLHQPFIEYLKPISIWSARNKMHSKSFGELKKMRVFPANRGIIQNFSILALNPHGDLGSPALTIRARCLLGQGRKPLKKKIPGPSYLQCVQKNERTTWKQKHVLYINLYVYIYIHTRNIL